MVGECPRLVRPRPPARPFTSVRWRCATKPRFIAGSLPVTGRRPQAAPASAFATVRCVTAPSQFSGHRQRFLQRFPDVKNAEKALKSATNPHPFFYFAECADIDLQGCWWVLGRLGGELEKQFALSGEILFLFTPYVDLQRRTFNVLTERLRQEVRVQQIAAHGVVRFTPDPTIAILWAPDPEATAKLESWNLEAGGSIAAAMPPLAASVDQQRAQIARALHEVLAARDLYRGRNPVTGNDFFGRQDTLLALRSELSAGRSIGLFGLRRSGKTSVVREFQRRSRSAGTAVVLSDLEAIGDIREMPAQLAADLTNTLRDLKDNDPTIWVGSEHEQRVTNPAELGARIVRVAEKNRQIRFVIALDEIESLVPLIEGDAQQVRLFLGSLRRAAQATNNVAILLTGVTTRFFDQSMLADGVENPLFGFVEEFFLRPFSPEETAILVRKLGRGMVLSWDDDALDLLQTAAGGFPFLVRDLASAVRRTALGGATPAMGTETLRVTRAMVEQTLPIWTESASTLWTEIMRTLGTHHPLMAEMARSANEEELSEWLMVGAEAQAAAKSLEALGLLLRHGDSWTRSDSLRSLQSLGSPKRVEAETVRGSQQRRSSDSERVRVLAALPESSTLEFKATARFNKVTGQADKKLELPILKTVAGFLNTQGGTLLVGVDDNGVILGITDDLKLFGGKTDRYELFLRNMLVTNLAAGAVSSFVDIRFPEVESHVVCEIVVSPGTEPVWVDLDGGDVLFVRNGNETRKLPNREFLSYAASRFPSSG